ncbi:hypothetical protein GPK54_07880 [Ruminococcus bicirculans]|nr:hypothetical protein [Ruminococcus bicirculans (ex Wegman et al. 2014)]
MGEYEKLGKVIGDAAIFMYVYGAIIAVVLILLGVLVARYIKKKNSKDNGNDAKKKYVSMRISIIVVVGVLILLAAPIIMEMFL